MSAPDPQIVRKIARTACLLMVETVAGEHIVHRAMAQHFIGHDNVYAWSEIYDRVLDELAAVLKPLTQPDGQQPADPVSGEQQDGAPGRVEAFLDRRAELQKQGGTAGRIGAEVIARVQTSVPWELTDVDLRAVLAERNALAARVAELTAEREADARPVNRLLRLAEADPALSYGPAAMAVRARFADRIAALDDLGMQRGASS